jgi:CRISPR-associated protein Cas5t
MPDFISLGVSVPICSFRKPYAREFLESERIPPPATLYGFLLSFIGEEDRHKYIGTQIALAVTKEPEVSTILRTIWRIKSKSLQPGTGNNKRPDYQEILTGLECIILVKNGELTERIKEASKHPEIIERFGGLSLGESRDLVNSIHFSPEWEDHENLWLINDPRGQYPLPVWVDHVGSKGTNWGQFNFKKMKISSSELNENHWITIKPKMIK